MGPWKAKYEAVKPILGRIYAIYVATATYPGVIGLWDDVSPGFTSSTRRISDICSPGNGRLPRRLSVSGSFRGRADLCSLGESAPGRLKGTLARIQCVPEIYLPLGRVRAPAGRLICVQLQKGTTTNAQARYGPRGQGRAAARKACILENPRYSWGGDKALRKGLRNKNPRTAGCIRAVSMRALHARTHFRTSVNVPERCGT